MSDVHLISFESGVGFVCGKKEFIFVVHPGEGCVGLSFVNPTVLGCHSRPFPQVSISLQTQC